MRKVIIIFVLCLLGLLVYGLYQFIYFSDNRLHITFCDVGQGDAIFIRTPKGSDILIDGGGDEKVLSCISSRMPFWDRSLDFVVLTHPHYDHYAGLAAVIERYSIKQFASEDVSSNTDSYASFRKLIKKKNIPETILFADDKIKTQDGVEVHILSPTKSYISKTTPTRMIGETSEFASLMSRILYKDITVLLTGNSQLSAFSHIIDLGSADILQVPHHGSASGLDSMILNTIQPQVAVISVGKHNRYNHPSPFILNLLKQKGILILRTDERGDIEFVTGGVGIRLLE